MKIGILTGGGDTSSLNAILHGAGIEAERLGHKLIGFRRGWKGVLNPTEHIELTASGINPSQGGTTLKTSRTFLDETNIGEAAENIKKSVDSLIAIGGDDTLSAGRRLEAILKNPDTISDSRKPEEILNIPICFVTKTIDNDVGRNSPQNLDYGMSLK